MVLDTFIKTNYKPLLSLSKSHMGKIKQSDIAADMVVELYFFLRDIDDGNNKIKELPSELNDMMALCAAFFKNQIKYYLNEQSTTRSVIHKYINKSNDMVTFNYPSDEPFIDKPEELENIKDKLLLNKVLNDLENDRLKAAYQYFYIDKLSSRQIANEKQFEGKKYSSVQWWKWKKQLHQHIKIQMNDYGYN